MMLGKKIFIVEDEMILNEQLKRFLEKNGYSVEIFPHGEPCLERLDEGVLPDAMLMDINLGKGRMDGPTVTKKIYEKYDIPIVLHSAYTDKATLDTTRDMTKYGYIQKVPGNEQFILATIEMALKLHSTEKGLKRSEEFYRTILSSISDTVLLTDDEGRFVYVCPNIYVIFRYTEDEVKAFHTISRLLGTPIVSEEPLGGKGEIKNMRAEIHDKWGQRHVLLVNIKRVAIGEGTLLYTFRDITELAEKEEALKNSEQKYQELSAHLQNIREEQNAELSREIHDDFGQALTALRMNITFMAETLEEEDMNKEDLDRAVCDMERITDTTAKKVRKISTELRSSVIDTEGILEALEWQVEEFKKDFDIAVEITSMGKDVELGEKKSLHVFRIVQEALTNCIRHSGASRIDIASEIDGEYLVITVKDDGHGFDTRTAEKGSGFGLIGMHERAKQCDGSLTVESSSGQGTELQLKIPINENERLLK